MHSFLTFLTISSVFVTTFVAAQLEQNHGSKSSTSHPYDHALEAQRNMIPKTSAEKKELCSVLSGTWYNQHGSELTLQSNAQGELTGDFHSIVGLNKLNSSASHMYNGRIGGAVARNRLLAFQVIWQNEIAITAWTGQCQICGYQEILFTSWILTEKQAACGEVWKANRFGQDIFKRERAFH